MSGLGQNPAMSASAEPGSEQVSSNPTPTTLSDEEYAQALSPRNVLARKRGLPTPYIPGGTDPDPEAAARAERRYVRLLIAMVLFIVVGGFTISIVGLILNSSGGPP